MRGSAASVAFYHTSCWLISALGVRGDCLCTRFNVRFFLLPSRSFATGTGTFSELPGCVETVVDEAECRAFSRGVRALSDICRCLQKKVCVNLRAYVNVCVRALVLPWSVTFVREKGCAAS